MFRPRIGVSDFRAWIAGLLLSVAMVVSACAVYAALGAAECSGEYRPVLGSGKQFFEVRGCLAREAGALIGIKKRLGIYDPRWMPVIE